MADSKKTIGEAAGAVVTTALGVYLQGNLQHPKLAMALYIIAGICLLALFLQWPLFHRIFGLQLISQTDSKSPPPANTAGGDNSGFQISGLSGSPVLVGDSALDKLRAHHPEPPPPARALPNLVVHKVKALQPGRNYLYDTFPGDELFVLPIENRIPGPNANGIVATLRFFTGTTPIGNSDRAYWYQKRAHEIELERNEVQEIVLGTFKDGRWNYFANPTRHIHTWRTPDREPEPPKSFALDKPAVMVVEVFSPYSADEAYVRGRYLIVPTANGCEIGEAL